jgi:hypothetical protein
MDNGYRKMRRRAALASKRKQMSYFYGSDELPFHKTDSFLTFTGGLSWGELRIAI